MARARSIACSRAKARRESSNSSKPSRATARLSTKVPGAVTADGEGPPPRFVESLDDFGRRAISCATAANISSACSIRAPRSSFRAAAHGIARSAAPGHSMAAAIGMLSPERVVEELSSIREPGVFIVDDVAFIQDKHGFEIGEAIARKGIRKKILSRDARRRAACATRKCSSSGRSSASHNMFLGIEAIDEEGLKKFRKRMPLGQEFRGAGIRPLARHRRGDQHHRRSRLGRGTISHRARVVHGGAGDGQYQHQHAVSGHGNLDRRAATIWPPAIIACSISSTRCCRPRCRWRSVLSGALAHPARALQQALELVDHAGAGQGDSCAAGAWADQFHAWHHAITTKSTMSTKCWRTMTRPVHYELPVAPRPQTNAPGPKPGALYSLQSRPGGRNIDEFH